MIEDWRPEMDLYPEKIHRLIINYNLNILNLDKFKKWIDERYKASQIYDEPDEIKIWKDVIDKFEELLN
jgi:hypothetical protein